MIEVAIVEDHPIYRVGLAEAIGTSPECLVCAAEGSIEEFDAGMYRTPDVVLLDLHLPGISGAEGVAHMRARGFAVLVVSASAAEHSVLDALAAGASGYLTKEAEPAEIIAAVRVVAEGGTYVSPTLASYLLSAARGGRGNSLDLTAREREILALVAQGERDQDIAAQLFISIRTVHGHLDRIRDKTGSRRRSELTRLAIERGIVPRSRPRER